MQTRSFPPWEEEIMATWELWCPHQPTSQQLNQTFTAFVAPIFPGYLPVVQGTQAQISDQVQAHNESLRKWKEYENVTKALWKQLIDSVDPAYIAHLEDPYRGFNKVPVKDILLDLFDNNGKLWSTELLANNKQFEEDWDPTETFQTVMANDAGQPYSAEQTLAKPHAIVFSTGLYHNTLEKWEEVPARQANYENFCKHIIQAQTRLQNKKTTKQQGYGIINLMRQEMAAMRSLIELQHQHQGTARVNLLWIKGATVGLMDMPSQRHTTVRTVLQKDRDIRMRQREQTTWVAVSVENLSVTIWGGQCTQQ
jgi:hypothetical protein